MPVSLSLLLLLLILGAFSQLPLLLLRSRPLLQPLFPLRFNLEPPSPAALPSRPAGLPATPPTVLLVDDEAGVRELMSAVLQNNGYRVLTAANGTAGLQVFTAHAAEVALVITDIHMPHGAGDSFVNDLRRIRPDMPVLYISGLGTGDDEPLPHQQRSSDPFLLKPFKPAALLETVNRLVRPSAG